MSGTKLLLLFCAIQTIIFGSASTPLPSEDGRSACVEGLTDLINEEETLLYLSTLDGTFIGVNHKNGDVLWQFKEEAAVKVPKSDQNALSPIFLPDPRDGSLYLLDSQNRYDLKKLQFTIQQLVSTSPCRSSDGIFYTGKKIDNWFMVDWRTGTKEALLNSDTADKVCPLMNRNSMFLGRTEYNLIIQDVTSKERRWNVTFYDYAADMLSPEKIKKQDHGYFAGSSTGKFAVFKGTNPGAFLWEASFDSPVIGVYLREGDRLVSVPFTTMDDNSVPFRGLDPTRQYKLSSTLYVGTHTHGLYALPALATSDSTVLLLNGPSSDDTISVPMVKENESVALLGYYEIPQDGIKRLQITGRSDAVIDMNDTVYGANTSARSTSKNIAVQTDESKTFSPKWDRHLFYQLLHVSIDYVLSSPNIELKIFMVTMLAMMLGMFVYFRAQVREFKQTSSSGYSRISATGSTIVTCIAEELPNGSTKVGKILFDSNHILGKGCEGTFVFKGEFDNRPVAVKRLLPECFTVADREVCLLRESDQHPNVIRYFCMEQDKQFRYIALELCSATLQEYTEKGVLNDQISPTETLSQAAAGLEHLHALNIVHRDIKPHNVLLSYPANVSSETRVRAMISDFGLCKKLQKGKASFSRKSGITGTDGWIAPEIIHGRGRTTASVDIFSLGCVFYYVLSKGKHPFGDSLSRQANIMDGKYKLNDFVHDEYELWSHLVSKMLTIDPLERPSIQVIKKHPAFWTKDQTLSFLQDVSDRIEKEDTSSKVLLELEMGNSIVLKGDWRDQIEPEIAEDLRKYRSYRADSVRDLLRALRNKKHHYRELSEAVREILGCIPDEFVSYWLDRFPKLLLHTWLAMQCVSHEGVFHKYYSSGYQFASIHDGVIPGWLQQGMNMSPRWKFLNKGVGGSPKYSGPRYAGGGGEKSNSPFFSMSNSGEKSAYNWRQRPKVVNEEEEQETDGKLAEELAADVEASHPIRVVVTGADEEEDCCENQENVKPVENNAEGEEDEEVEVEGEEGKWQRKVRSRRGRRKKKIVHVTLPVRE